MRKARTLTLEYLLSADDKFVHLLAEPLIYSGDLGESFYSDVVRIVGQSCSDHEIAVCEVAIILASSRYSIVTTDDLLRRMDQLLPRLAEHSRWRGRVARALVCLNRGVEYRGVEAELATCEQSLRTSDDHFTYALCSKGRADALQVLGRHSEAEECYENATATFRRFGHELLAAFSQNNLGVLKKRIGEYEAARACLKRALAVESKLDLPHLVVDVVGNLGIVAFKAGDWSAAEKWFHEAHQLGKAGSSDAERVMAASSAPAHLQLTQRQFANAQVRLLSIITRDDGSVSSRNRALAYEFLGELSTELGAYDQAAIALNEAYVLAASVLPESDLMSEVLRRQAQLQLATGELVTARATALRCIRLCRKISDRYELGAAVRVLGEIYVAQKKPKHAEACFRSAVRTLKGIHECYELMRTLYAQGRLLAGLKQRAEAEISLLEARQLSKKLELDYYQALIAIALVDTLGPQDRFEEAQVWLQEATTLRDGLEGTDRERVERELSLSASTLQDRITSASVKSAETIRTMCRVYEDARFPIEDMKADLAYQVAQSVGGESLWLVARSGGGYRIPLVYNIAVNDAKSVVRELDTAKGNLLGVNGEPRVLRTSANQTLVATPCRDANDQHTGFLTCVRFDGLVSATTRQIELMCAGAEALVRLVEENELRKPSGEVDEEPPARHPKGSFKEIVTIDTDMIRLIKTAERAAGSVAPILLEGETGVGKELFARAIHGASQRKNGPFIALNAGGMSVSLLESELFGHVRGAFTDARSERVGLVESAREGTLFLDEIGEMGEEMQVKLLRLLENGEYRRLGESTMRKADVRIISATNRNLKDQAEQGKFRFDLYYRLTTVKFTVPPLRMRPNDIQLLVRQFLRECAAMNGIADRHISIDVKAMEALELYNWPGNVRELHNEILRVISLIGKGDLVKFSMLSDSVKEYLQTAKRGEGLLDRSVDQFERRLILKAMDRNDWNRMQTADSIGVPRTTLLAKLKRLNVASK